MGFVSEKQDASAVGAWFRLRLSQIGLLIKETVQAWLEDNVLRMSAALAFYTTFSVAPALLIGLGVAGAFLGGETAKEEFIRGIGELVSPKVAETIAREVGARTAVLDPIEGITTPGADYFTVMRANLTALTTALGCTS